MARTLVIVGKQGPLFGDRPSATEVTADYGDGTAVVSRVNNWPKGERVDALRAALDQLDGIGVEW